MKRFSLVSPSAMRKRLIAAAIVSSPMARPCQTAEAISSRLSTRPPEPANSSSRSISRGSSRISLPSRTSAPRAGSTRQPPSSKGRWPLMLLRLRLLQTNGDRIRAGPQIEFGGVERRLAEGGVRVVREAEFFERPAEPIHVELSVAVEILEHLDRVHAGLDAAQGNDGLARLGWNDTVAERIGTVLRVAHAIVERDTQIAGARRNFLDLDNQGGKRRR